MRCTPVPLSLGFRPFFLLALIHAVAAMGVWAWFLHRDPGLVAGFPGGATGWHAREMVFGYAPAMVAGFLLTAVRNWTGRETATGRPLAILAGLWLAGRLAGPLGTGGLMVSGTADLAFMVALVIALARPIMAADQLRQQSGVLHPRTGRAWSLRWSPSPPWCG
ncbi:MAG: NnrS family protein, partial [Thiohalospira sp.]